MGDDVSSNVGREGVEQKRFMFLDPSAPRSFIHSHDM